MLSYITQENIYNLSATMSALDETFQNIDLNEFKRPELSAMALSARYLEKMMLTEATVPFFEFYSYKKHFQNQD